MKLHTEGTKICNEEGKEVLLRGVNCAGLEWDAGNESVLRAACLAADEWRANIIRLPVSQDRWFGWCPEQKDPDSAERYRALVDRIVRELAERGCYLILDLHWNDRGEKTIRSGQQKMPDTNSIVFWEDAAARYADCENVLFGLYNEPHDVDWKIWLDGGAIAEADGTVWQAVGMRTLLKTVRSVGAENLCVLGGLDWGYTFRGFEGYDELLETGGNIVFDSHVYPWKPLDWDSDTGGAASRCPLLIGECGHYGDDAQPREGKQCLPAAEWVPRILSWIDSHGYHLTAWDFHPHAGPCLISDFDGTPTPWYGALVRDYLRGER